jgi:hypothetical protein
LWDCKNVGCAGVKPLHGWPNPTKHTVRATFKSSKTAQSQSLLSIKYEKFILLISGKRVALRKPIAMKQFFTYLTGFSLLAITTVSCSKEGQDEMG